LHEIKNDGCRAFFKDGRDVRLVSRIKRRSITRNYLMSKSLPADCLILDPKLLRWTKKASLRYQLLQLFKKSGDVPLVNYVLDLLFLEGKRSASRTAERQVQPPGSGAQEGIRKYPSLW
jgi:ATP-dependent DNA ligase